LITGCGKYIGRRTLPQRLKAAIDFVALAARLKPRPFKAKSKSDRAKSKFEFFAACKALSANKPVIAAVNRRATRNQVQQTFPQLLGDCRP